MRDYFSLDIAPAETESVMSSFFSDGIVGAIKTSLSNIYETVKYNAKSATDIMFSEAIDYVVETEKGIRELFDTEDEDVILRAENRAAARTRLTRNYAGKGLDIAHELISDFDPRMTNVNLQTELLDYVLYLRFERVIPPHRSCRCI